MTFKKILVALELSHTDEAVFSEAVNLAQSIGAHLTIIHCLSDLTDMAIMSQSSLGTGYGFPETYAGNTMSPAMVNMDLIEQANLTKYEQTEKHLAQYQQKAALGGISAQVKCYESTGSVGSQICQIAGDLNLDLIIIGRKGHNGIAEALLGSVSNYVLHNAPCAILVIQ